jgi:hypothetical protein
MPGLLNSSTGCGTTGSMGRHWELNQRYIKDFTPEEGAGLYHPDHPQPQCADDINEARLAALPGKEYRFGAEVSGDFPEHTFPAPGTCWCLKRAQVMFLRNDASGEKRYFNGKIGKIRHISRQEIRIKCPGDADEILVEPVEWENIKYTVNEETKEIRRKSSAGSNSFPSNRPGPSPSTKARG